MESLMAVAIAALMGAALLYAVTGSLTTSQVITERAAAQGLANMLMEEIAQAKYSEDISDPYQYPLVPGTGEGPFRRTFDDVDDFNGYEMSPPEDIWGIPLGTGDEAGGLRNTLLQVNDAFLKDFRVTVDVYYADDDDPSVNLAPGVKSDSKAVEINVYLDRPTGTTPLATLRRVFGNIHQSP